MKKQFFTLVLGFTLSVPLVANAQSTSEWLPQSGVKSPYSPLAVPTTLKPVETSLAKLLKEQNFHIVTASNYGNNAILFTLKHVKETDLCILNAPVSSEQSDQNVPTSRCWKLD